MTGEYLALLGLAVAVGIGAALVPIFVNAEVWVVAMALQVDSASFLTLLILVHVIVTTIGKAVVFQLARQGTRRIKMVEKRPPRTAFGARVRRFNQRVARTRAFQVLKRLNDWLISLLDRPYSGGLTALVSSLTGIPPLAIVTLLAGASRQPMWLFLTMVFIGRFAQFMAIAFVLYQVSWF